MSKDKLQVARRYSIHSREVQKLLTQNANSLTHFEVHCAKITSSLPLPRHFTRLQSASLLRHCLRRGVGVSARWRAYTPDCIQIGLHRRLNSRDSIQISSGLIVTSAREEKARFSRDSHNSRFPHPPPPSSVPPLADLSLAPFEFPRWVLRWWPSSRLHSRTRSPPRGDLAARAMLKKSGVSLSLSLNASSVRPERVKPVVVGFSRGGRGGGEFMIPAYAGAMQARANRPWEFGRIAGRLDQFVV